MNNKKYLLSICIPTYNRENYLKRLLESIVQQDGFTDEVSIIINDGPSQDNTELIVKEFQEKYINIIYYKNSVAVGMLPAILESIQMSNGEYTWLFGSDDFMAKGSLKVVLDIIKKTNPKIILSNRHTFHHIEECNRDTNDIPNVLLFNGFLDFSIYLGLDENEKFEDKHNYFTFMSIYCFNTKFYNDRLKYVQKTLINEEGLKKHYFNYILILFSKILSDDIISIIEFPHLVYCKSDNHNRTHNKKISQDIKMLCNYIGSHYVLPSTTKKLFNKFIFRWWFACNVLAPINKILKKIGLYKSLSYIWRKYFLKTI